MLFSTEAGLTTVKTLPFPRTPCADALIAIVPGATPVASPASVTVAVPGFALDQVNAIPLISFPYWSLATALNCRVPPAQLTVAPRSLKRWPWWEEGRARSEPRVR